MWRETQSHKKHYPHTGRWIQTSLEKKKSNNKKRTFSKHFLSNSYTALFSQLQAKRGLINHNIVKKIVFYYCSVRPWLHLKKMQFWSQRTQIPTLQFPLISTACLASFSTLFWLPAFMVWLLLTDSPWYILQHCSRIIFYTEVTYYFPRFAVFSGSLVPLRELKYLVRFRKHVIGWVFRKLWLVGFNDGRTFKHWVLLSP